MIFEVAFWTPINAKSGFGHFYRTLGLYQELENSGLSVTYFTNSKYIELENNVNILSLVTDRIDEISNFLSKSGIQVLIIDWYGINEAIINILLKRFRLLIFDSRFENFNVDGIINYNPYSVSEYLHKNDKTKYFLGLEYNLFRKELRGFQCFDIIKNRVFINFGGSDINGATLKVLPYLDRELKYDIVIGKGCSDDYYNEIIKRSKDLEIDLNLYRQPENFFEIIAKAEYAITSCSTVIYELAFLNKPFICVNVVDNQNVLEEYLKSKQIQTLHIDSLGTIRELIKRRKFNRLAYNIQDNKSKDLICFIKGLLSE